MVAKMLKMLRIVHGDYLDPRKEFDNLGTMVAWHKRYRLGDPHRYASPREWLETIAQDVGMDSEKAYLASDDQLWGYVDKRVLVLPLYLHDHGSLSISVVSFGDPWDSGQVGWIYASYEAIRKTLGVKRVDKKALGLAREALVDEVRVYDAYLRGDPCFTGMIR